MKMWNIFGALFAGITAMSAIRTWLRGKNRRLKSVLVTYLVFPPTFVCLKKCGSNPTPRTCSRISSVLSTTKGTTKTARRPNSHLRLGESVVKGMCVELLECFARDYRYSSLPPGCRFIDSRRLLESNKSGNNDLLCK